MSLQMFMAHILAAQKPYQPNDMQITAFTLLFKKHKTIKASKKESSIFSVHFTLFTSIRNKVGTMPNYYQLERQ